MKSGSRLIALVVAFVVAVQLFMLHANLMLVIVSTVGMLATSFIGFLTVLIPVGRTKMDVKKMTPEQRARAAKIVREMLTTVKKLETSLEVVVKTGEALVEHQSKIIKTIDSL